VEVTFSFWVLKKSYKFWRVSEERSESALALNILRGMFFVTVKSIKSGTFLGSACQYVGLQGES